MKTITILSGKGGVGKSSLSASIAVTLSEKYKIITADCDVDAANLGLLFGIKSLKSKEYLSTNNKAFVNKKAKSCKNIVDNCAFSAISWDEKKQLPKINSFLCEGCGVCKLLCPDGISIKSVQNATIGQGQTKYGFPIISGQLKMGESGSGKIVSVVKQRAEKLAKEIKADFIIVDSAPGIGCPVIASIRGSDYIIAVTEPMPTAFNSLKRVLAVADHFKVPYGIIINKWDINKKMTKKIETFAKEKKIKILNKLSYDRKFIEAAVKMIPVLENDPKYKKIFENIIKNIEIIK